MTILAATAAVDVTPEPGMILSGHWSQNPSHSVLKPLGIRTMVFEANGVRAALTTMDTIGIEREHTRELRKRIHEACGIPETHVMLCCSHTHCAPPTLHALGDTPDPGFVPQLHDRIVDSVVAAAGRVQPVKLALGAGSCHFNVNRRPFPGEEAMRPNYGALVDRRVRVMRVDGADGEALAVLFHYSCHPTSKPGSDGFISPDYPGYARAMIEERLGCRALFLPGCFGNIRPNVLDPDGETFGTASPEQLEDFGRELSDAVCGAADALRTSVHRRLAAGIVDLPLTFAEPPDDEFLSGLVEQGLQDGAYPVQKLVHGPWAQRVREQKKRGTLPEHELTEMQKLSIGPLSLLSIPGEPVQEIGHRIERRYRQEHGGADLWPLGYTNDMVGYLCTERQKREGGYEPNAYSYFARPAGFADEEETIVATAAKLMG